MNASKNKNSKTLHRGKKLEAQKPLKASHTDIPVVKVMDKSSP
ncbi:MAG: hypothetical protein WB987_07030 [Candidatus Acidiferrales bacterium]